MLTAHGAFAGVALTGFGYSLVYPSLGVEAVRRAPARVAMGADTAFLDLSLGLASPSLGLIAGSAGLGSVFLASALVVLSSAAIAVRILYPPSVRYHATVSTCPAVVLDSV